MEAFLERMGVEFSFEGWDRVFGKVGQGAVFSWWKGQHEQRHSEGNMVCARNCKKSSVIRNLRSSGWTSL